MTQWHGYFAIEDLNLSAQQRQTLVDALKQLGPSTSPQPAYINHHRARLDSRAVIFGAQFNRAKLTIDAFKQRLATVFGIDPSQIGHTISRTTFSSVPTVIVTFSRGGTNYIRVAFFGYDPQLQAETDTCQVSNEEALAYLKQNLSDWEVKDD